MVIDETIVSCSMLISTLISFLIVIKVLKIPEEQMFPIGILSAIPIAVTISIILTCILKIIFGVE